MDPLSVLFLMGFILSIGASGKIIFDKVGLPETIWLLLVGFLLGPVTNTLETPALAPLSELVSSLAIVILLFEAGLETKFGTIRRHGLKGLGLGFVRSALALVSVSAILTAIGYSVLPAILMGLILGGLSFAVVVPLALRLDGLSSKAKTVLSLSSLTDNFTVVLAFVVIDIITLSPTGPGSVAEMIAGSFSTGIVMGILFGVVGVYILKRVESKDLRYVGTLSMIFLLYPLVEYIGASGAIAAFFFGLVFGNFKTVAGILGGEDNKFKVYLIRNPHRITSFFMRTFFFVFLGALTDIRNPYFLEIGFLLALLLLLIQQASLKILNLAGVKFKDYDFEVIRFMIPVGLSAAIMANYIFANQIPGTEGFTDMIFTVILVTIIITTTGIFFAERKSPKE